MTDPREFNRLMEAARRRAQQLRREAVAGLGHEAAQALSRWLHATPRNFRQG